MITWKISRELAALALRKLVDVALQLPHGVPVSAVIAASRHGSGRLPLVDHPVEDGVRASVRECQLTLCVERRPSLGGDVLESALGQSAEAGLVAWVPVCRVAECGCEPGALLPGRSGGRG
ncbi:MAG: hypothetical protein ACRDPZ_05620 [Gaiellaceae bacterium]